MHFQCRSFIGKTSPFSWSQFWENEPDDPNLVLTKGHLFGLINLSSAEGGDFSTIGHELINFIDEHYFADSESIAPSLNSTVKQLLDQYPDLQITLVLAVVHRGQLYLISHGQILVTLVRASQIATLVNRDNQDQALSGAIHTDDRVFISTQNFINTLSWDSVKLALSQPKLQTLEDDLLSLLYSADTNAASSAVLVEICDDVSVLPTPEASLESEADLQSLDNLPPLTVIPVPKVAIPHSSLTSIFSHSRDNPQITVNPAFNSATRHRKRFNLLIATILLLGLSFSIYYGNQKRTLSLKQTQYENYQKDLDAKLMSAAQVRSLNLKTAQGLAVEARDIVTKMEALSIPSTNLDSYKTQIDQLLAQTGSVESTGPQMFFDTTLINKDAKYISLYLSGNSLYLLDKSNHKIDALDLSQKSHKNISEADKVGDLRYITDIGGQLYGVDDKSVYLIKPTQLDAKFDLSKASASLTVAGFGSWNNALYLLDTNGKTIWKLTPDGSGFNHSSWLKDGQTLDSQASSLAINGKLWVLTSMGQITPYLRGSPDSFKKLEDVDTTSAKQLVTTAEGDYLAFADDKNMVYVYHKNGNSKAQFNLGNHKIQSLVISSDATKLYILSDDAKIYLENLN